MPMASFFSPEEVESGFSARRASTLLFAIESRTAFLVEQEHLDTALYLTASGAPEQERAFLESLAQAREARTTVTIQQLERFAPQWASLLPATPEPSLNAALARLIGGKYKFTRDAVPQLRAVLHLDDRAVREAFERTNGVPLDTIYVPQVSARQRVRFAWSALGARLETLPPFWLAFLLTLPAGPGLLALPIAISGIGAVPGIVLLVFFGIVNALTAAALAETVTRSGTMRFGLGFMGQLVSDYLGSAGSWFLSLTLGINNFLVLIVFYLGIAGTLQDATGFGSPFWLVGVFAIGLYFLTRRTLNTTIGFALVVVVINIILLIVIPLPALASFQLANFSYVNLPLLSGQGLDPSSLQLVLGIMLTNYFSHLLVANYGKVALRRDPRGGDWLRGSMASIGATTLLSCLWVVCVNGAISPETLAAQTGTVLAPLAELIGPYVNLLGSLLVILGLGIATIHISLGNYYLMQERLPTGLSQRTRFFLALGPLFAVFLLAEWLALTGMGSFAGLLGFTGVISLPLLGGIFPVLLLAAARRKGDFAPGVTYRWLGNPILLGALYFLFVSAIFIYALFIWEGLVERFVTFLVGVVVVVFTAAMLRRGALTPRAVVLVRSGTNSGRSAAFQVVSNGSPMEVGAVWHDGRGKQQRRGAEGAVDRIEPTEIQFDLPQSAARELKVWTYRESPGGGVQPVGGQVAVRDGDKMLSLGMPPQTGAVTVPFSGSPIRVDVKWNEHG